MQLAGFRTWLGQQPSIKKQSTIDQYVADASRVERCYGDLDELYGKTALRECSKSFATRTPTSERVPPNRRGFASREVTRVLEAIEQP